MKIYGLKNCDSCRKARRTLKGLNIQFEFYDLRDTPASVAGIQKWLEAVGVSSLLNKRSTTWKSLSEAEKLIASEDEAANLMARHQTLLKRPIIVTQNAQIFCGWTSEVEEAVLRQ